MPAYYNEIDAFCAEWLRNLIRAGEIAPGEVDERDIRDVRPDELDGFDQCHFFAGIGGWSRALRLAGWPDDRPVWTGSCPCQPFSTAGSQVGFDDERHLWPAWHWLIQQRRPPVVFGEQVANGAARLWIDLVQSDLEGIGYAFGPVDLPAGGVGAPHQRQRAWFVAESSCERFDGQSIRLQPGRPQQAGIEIAGDGAIGRMADANGEDQRGRGIQRPAESEGSGDGTTRERSAGLRTVSSMDNTTGARHAGARSRAETETRHETRVRGSERGRGAGCEPFAGALHGFWRDSDWLLCTDGKWRPVEPGAFPLAHGLPGRVGRLRAYGNAIVPQVAAEIIQAYGG